MNKEKNKISTHRRRSSSIARKIGIMFIIPISLAICGALIILSAGWKYITAGLDLSSFLFASTPIELSKTEFKVNNEQIIRPDIGENFATLKIPSLNLEKPVFHGDGKEQLSQGVGHFVGSTIPGEGGNVVLAAHRDTAFNALQDIKEGDEVIVSTYYGDFTYKVSSIRITNPDDTTVCEPTDKEQLTLYTCYPFNFIGSAPQRYVVVCDYTTE